MNQGHHSFAARQRARVLASTVAAWLCVAPSALPQIMSTARPEISIAGSHYKVLDRVVFDDAIVFKRPDSNRAPGGSTVPGGSVPLGDLGDGGVGCVDMHSLPSESVRQTFARIPGDKSPSLFASVTSVRLAPSRKEGTFEIALFNPCGPWIAVPIADRIHAADVDLTDVRRLSLHLYTDVVRNESWELFLFGIAITPESYRLLGLDEAIILVVPFKSADEIDTQNGPEGLELRSLEMAGWYDSGSYSKSDMAYHQLSRQYRVPTVRGSRSASASAN